MTIAHGLQYLLFVGMVAGGHAGRGRRVYGVAAMAVTALTLGTALAAASHLHAGDPATRILYGAYLGVVMTHFVIDAGTWRLRDPFPRQLLSRCLPSFVGPSPRRGDSTGAPITSPGSFSDAPTPGVA